ncbi:putative disease resistance protein At3g14460 [Telopea speciosissima]|uniref:putative disease resistance protein At3g14460 n=1 Tax=Telopea speciosissima TaxID=54955 RepID=UPI001CC4AB64|nr:putative disease resistance protein At3g14460 [Telopea speciosissima]
MSGFEIAGLVLTGAGILLSPVIKALFDRFLSNWDGQNPSNYEISMSVRALSSSIDKAEIKLDQLKYEEVKDDLWLRLLKTAISDVEDMLDEIGIDGLKHRLKAGDKVSKSFPSADVITNVRKNIDAIIRNTFDNGRKPASSPASVLDTTNHENGGWDSVKDSWPIYENLSMPLKKCLKLLSMFPQSDVFDQRDNIVHLWMALDFIQIHEGLTLQDAGRRYYAEKLQSFSSNGIIHHQLADDTIHELAKFASRGECQQLEDRYQARTCLPASLHHLLSIHCTNFWDTFDDLAVAFTGKKKKDTAAAGARCEKLRTIMHIKTKSNPAPASASAPQSMAAAGHAQASSTRSEPPERQSSHFARRRFKRLPSKIRSSIPGFTSSSNELGLFKRLRVLDISCGCCIIQIPESIGGLKHLRCLNLSNAEKIVELPKTICKLLSLLILKLDGCLKLEELPPLNGLVSLLHLILDKKKRLVSMPEGIEQLTNLETFTGAFVVGKKHGKNIGVLKNMNNLRGSLCISNLENVSTLEEAKKAALDDKPGLSQLKFEWKEPPKKDKFKDVLEGLKPHGNLKKLKISGYGGEIFPNWVSSVSFIKLEKVSLIKCKCLPPLRHLPNLNSLSISGSDQIELKDGFFFEIGSDPDCSGDGYSSLKILKFKNCTNLEKFDELQKFNCSLVIKRCPALTDWMDQQQAWTKGFDASCMYQRI